MRAEELYGEAGAAVEAERWQAVLDRYTEMEDLGPEYVRDPEGWRRLAASKVTEQQERERLGALFDTAVALVEGEHYEQAGRLIDEIERGQPGYRGIDTFRRRVEEALADSAATGVGSTGAEPVAPPATVAPPEAVVSPEAPTAAGEPADAVSGFAWFRTHRRWFIVAVAVLVSVVIVGTTLILTANGQGSPSTPASGDTTETTAVGDGATETTAAADSGAPPAALDRENSSSRAGGTTTSPSGRTRSSPPSRRSIRTSR